MKKYIRNLFFKIISPAIIQQELDATLIKQQLTKVILGNGSKLSFAARIYNLQNIPDKITIGSNSLIEGEFKVFKDGGEIVVGSWCYIGIESRIWAQKKITIGDNVLISHNVNIMDTNAHEINVSLRHENFKNSILSLPYNMDKVDCKEVIIEDDVWIGFNSIILKGITIGRGSVIAAGSVVVHDVPSFTMVAGNPAKIVKQLQPNG